MPSGAGTRVRSALTALGAAATLAAGVLAPASATAATPRSHGERYVALGDSFTSAPSVPRQTDTACGRSDANYPSLVREELGFGRFTDVSCAGAATEHLWQRQPVTGNAPQLAALGPDTALVTLGIGGNDVGFMDVLARCVHPTGEVPRDAPCQRAYTREGGGDELQRRIDDTAPKIAAALDAVHRRAPHARVAVVGYPTLIGDDVEGCRRSLRIADGDLPYLRGTVRNLNAMLRRQAVAHGDLYVNTHGTTFGHDACRPFADRWVEGLTTYPRIRPAAPFHPNEDGERAMAEAVVDALVDGP
ncbi:hypothetical protein BLA24_01725 [Streptomyces cinnamoneus]|uniref:SGNH hydrolase-type esterase domain-containing protein n=1 Tax=Streptomyces cinnamoneus TaxID=53446 RepID=A0A2G1XQ91_STRCJ|nr:hypothetical protein BLA24_01725 [Streptomyces cinnamoneus]